MRYLYKQKGIAQGPDHHLYKMHQCFFVGDDAMREYLLGCEQKDLRGEAAMMTGSMPPNRYTPQITGNANGVSAQCSDSSHFIY